MILPITTLSASLLAILFIGLTLRVITMRRKGIGPSVGMNENETFLRAVRAHSNFSEYTPIFLILLGLYEIQGGNQSILLITAVLFILGRFAHAIGFGFLKTGPWRVVGMAMTITAILTLTIFNILLFV